MTKFIKHINISKVRFSFVSARNLMLSSFLLFSVFVLAQPTVGTQSVGDGTPGWPNYSLTWNHNHNTGDDGVLVVILHSATNNTVSGVKYNNVSMTQRLYGNDGNAKVGIYELENPPTGTHEVKVSMSVHGGGVAGIAQSFTGAEIGGEVFSTNESNNNSNVHTRTRSGLTVNSKIIVVGTSNGRGGSPVYDVEGSSYTPTKKDKNVAKMGVAISDAITSTSVSVTTRSGASWSNGYVSNHSLEILAASSCSNGTVDAGSALSGICSGGTSGAMGGDYGGGATAATWSGGAGSWTNASNSNTATYTAGASETGTITLTLTATGGCATVTDTKTITVTAAPSAGSLSGTQGVCVSGSTTFSSTVSGGTWSSNNTGVATVNSSSGAVSGVSAGIATITYTKAGSGGCSNATATRTVTVSAAPSAGSLSGTQGICASGSTTFSSTVSGGTWSSNTTGVATVNSSSGAISGVSAGTATITYTKAGSGGCSDATATRTVTVTAAPTITGSNDGSRAGEGAVSIQATASAGSVDWYAGSSGGSSLGNSSSGVNWTTPSISTTTIYYAQANNGTCTSAARTPVTATVLHPPGGVSSNLLLWLKADAQTYENASPGTDAAENNDDVLQWHDQSGLSHDATVATGSYPHYDEDGINFNPSLTFTQTSSEYLAIEDGLFGTETKDEMTAYTVTTHNTSTASPVFSEELSNSEWFRWLGDWSSNGLWWQLGSSTTGSGRNLDGTHEDIKHGRPIIFSLGSGKSNSNSSGEEQYIRYDGEIEKVQNGYDASATGNNSDFNIGKYNSSEFDGNIAEIIIYDGIPSAVEEIQIQSYLAIKYGITLSNDNDADASAGETVSGSITEGDYVDSDGSTVIWDYSTYSSYHYDIAGLGRDDIQGLHQKQSKSANSDAIVAMSTEAIGTTNAGISTTLNDGTYLLWGNDNASLNGQITELPSGYRARVSREWVVEKTGTVANVHIEFDISNTGLVGEAKEEFYLLKTGNNDFSSGVTPQVASTLVGDKVTFNDVNFSDGDHFTLATKQPGPGGTYDKVLLWLKADAGTNTTTNNERVTSWKSQGLKYFKALEVSSAGPTYKTDGINGYPALDFSSSQIKIAGGIAEGESKYKMFTYIVAQTHSISGDNTMFRQLGGLSSHWFIFRHNNSSNLSADFYNGHYSETKGRIVGAGGQVMNQTHVWTLGSTNGAASTTPYEKGRYIYRDGNHIVSNDNNDDNYLSGTNDFHIGSYGAGSYYDGLIAEIIILDDAPTGPENQKILSYLNNKYGLTTGNTENFINTDGTSTWTYNSDYNNMIAGIQRDDLTGTDKKQAKSEVSNSKITMSTQTIASTNAENTTTLGVDKSALMWANNDDAFSIGGTQIPASFNERLQKQWLVKKTGTVDNILVEVDLTGVSFAYPTADKFALVTDDDGNFSSGTRRVVATSFTNNKLTFASVNFTDKKYFTIMNSVNVLPVELLSFTTVSTGDVVILNWKTASEINNDYFAIEKSMDGINWDFVIQIAGAGNSDNQLSYTHIDYEGCQGYCYYRLTQVDFDGAQKAYKSTVVNSEAEAAYNILVTPNPIKTEAHITCQFPEDGIYNFSIISITGQTVYKAKIMGVKGYNNFNCPTEQHLPGIYYYMIRDANGNMVQQKSLKN